jgi:Lipocalin-like domain
MIRIVVFALLALIHASGALADNSKLILGVWKLMKHDTEFQDGSPPRKLFGQNPPGYIIFTPEGRMRRRVDNRQRRTRIEPTSCAP